MLGEGYRDREEDEGQERGWINLCSTYRYDVDTNMGPYTPGHTMKCIKLLSHDPARLHAQTVIINLVQLRLRYLNPN